MSTTTHGDLAWQTDQAVCRRIDPGLPWLADETPPRRDVTKARDVMRGVCRACPLTQSCLDYALPRYDILGFWGGTTSEERSRMRGTVPAHLRRAS